MTYDVLNKATKKQLISWIRENVFLPNISDEDFLRDIALRSLFEEDAELIAAHKAANERLAGARDNPVRFMQIMVEIQKLSERMEKVNKRISALMDTKRGGKDIGR